MSSNTDYAHAAPGTTGVDPAHAAAAHLPIVDADAGRIGWFATGRKKIALCGFASSSRHRMPFDDPDWIIVGLNQLYRHIPRIDVQVDIHANWREDNVEGTDHPRWLAQCGIPVVMVHREPEVPTAVRNPKETLDAYFDCGYATSTVAHELRLFLYEIDQEVQRRLAVLPAVKPGAEVITFEGRGKKRRKVRHTPDVPMTIGDAHARARAMYGEYAIGIFGIDLIVGTEYEHQRQCAEFWIGEAEGRGINIVIPPESALLKQLWCYGYEKEPQGWPFKASELDGRGAALDKQFNEVMTKRHECDRLLATLDGARQENGMLRQIGELRHRGGSIPMPGTE